MTANTKIGLVVFGVALALACRAAGVMTQAQQKPGAQDIGRGHFRIQIDDKGVLRCFRGTTTTPCEKSNGPTGNIKSTIVTSIVVVKSNPCYLNHNGEYYEVPCS